MSADRARMLIVIYSLVLTGSLLSFLALSQIIGMRFDYSKQENFRLIDIVLPTFLGYLGSASHFLFNSTRGRAVPKKNQQLLTALVHGPFILFAIFVASLFLVHYLTHLPLPDDAARIDPLEFETLSRYLSMGLGILAATVSIISGYLFGGDNADPDTKAATSNQE